ncbi:ATP-binding protein [Vibrio owensii]|uniref:ATP-binding protein n=1 Tax=Vibrio owensii TaxID=696485 RepID=UPI00155DB6AA|nr:transporter substrate-binding domain-containing protein [Vibrio owensii]
MKVGVTSTPFPPYWVGSTELPQGLVHDIAVVMETKLGVKIEYVAFDTIPDVEQALESGEIDLVIGYIKSSQREDKFLFSIPLYDEAIVGWISPEKADIENVSDLTWACLKGHSQCTRLRELHFDKVVETDDYTTFYEKLNTGEADALIGVYDSFLYYFENNNIENQELYFDKRFGIVAARFMVNGKAHAFKSELDEFVLSIKQNTAGDIFKRIYKEYNPQESIYSKWYGSKHNEILIKYTIPGDVFPYSYVNKDTGQYVGYVHDLFERISSITPITFEYIPSGARNVEDILSKRLADVVPIINKENYNERRFTTTNDIIDVQYTHIETLKIHDSNIYGVLDRFSYLKGDPRVENFLVYKDLDKILADLKSGKISHAYINKHIVDNLINIKKDTFFKVIPKGDYIDLDTKAPMLLRIEDIEMKRTLEEAFKIISKKELDSLWSKYNTVDYHIGYNENQIRTVLFLVFLSVSISLILIIRFMRKKIDGVNKKTELSEGQQRFLLEIIDNIPSFVCIRNEHGGILLSNRSFKEFSAKYYSEDESRALKELIDNGEVELRHDLSEYLVITDESHAMVGRHFHVVNQSVVHYVDDMVLFMTVLTDITELKEREKFLEASVQQKKNFLAIISHELRTPISGILGLMELLEDRIKDKLSLEILDNASASTSKLKLLVDDILDLSKLESHQLRINVEQYNLPQELCPLIRNFESLAVRKGLSFQFYWKPSPYFMADVDLLRVTQILNNILSNAVKFTEVGTISCRVELSSNKLSFVIKDMGIGMDNEELNSLFDPFVQAQDNIARRYGGTGLGMSIVKSLVDLMGGEIQVTSAKKVGTSVSVGVPVKAIAFDAIRYPSVYQTDNRASAAWLEAMMIKHSPKTPQRDHAETNFYPDTILKLLSDKTDASQSKVSQQRAQILSGRALVVDDDPINRFLIKMQLEKLGVQSELASDAIEAFNLISSEEHSFSVLITDCHMPGMNGFELTKKVRDTRKEYSSIPIVACTADNSSGIAIKAEEVNINAVLYKPYDLSELYEVLKSFLPVYCHNEPQQVKQEDELSYKRENWLSGISEKDKIAMAKAVSESLKYCLKQLSSDPKNQKSIVHRLKGAAGALSLEELVNTCQELESAPDNVALKTKLVEQIERILLEAQAFVDKTISDK